MHLKSIGRRTLGWPDKGTLHLVAYFSAVALVDILAGPHDFAGLVSIFGLYIADDEAIWHQIDRVVLPSRIAERLTVVIRDSCVALTVIIYSIGMYS